MNPKDTCETCEWYFKDVEQCRRHAPIPDRDPPSVTARWPCVYKTDACGEHSNLKMCVNRGLVLEDPTTGKVEQFWVGKQKEEE